MEQEYPSLPQVEEIKPEEFSPLFTKVQRIYIGQFREWFGITAPTSVVAAVVLVEASQKVRTIVGGVLFWSDIQERITLIEGLAVTIGSFFVAWFLGCFALAAIATVVGRLDGEEEDAPLRDSHQRAREHLWAIIMTSIATFVAFGVGLLIAAIAVLTISKVSRHFWRYYYPVTLIGRVLVAGVVARFGMAIPLVVRGDIGVGAALNESLKIGERHKGFLYLLVIQSVVGSYVGWYAVHYMLLLVPNSIRFTVWYGWGALIVSALASAAVSPPMFIGFSLLAEEKTLSAEVGA